MKKKKEDLYRMVHAAKEERDRVNDTSDNAMQGALSTLTECTKALKTEIGELKEKMESVQKNLPSDASPTTSTTPLLDSNPQAMRKALQSVLLDEKYKTEMVISNAEDDGKDEEFIKRICEKVDFDVMPIKGTTRLGKKTDAGKRPLKVTFTTEFDARAFRSRCDQNKRTSEDFPNIRIRPCRNSEEQKLFITSLGKAKEMNKAAKEAGDAHSFSVRDNGEIWKFEMKDGKWKRDKDWEADESIPKSRNASGN